MPNKKTKQEIREVVEKYLGTPVQDNLKKKAYSSASWLSFGIFIDIVMFSGVGTGFALFAAWVVGSDGLSHLGTRQSLSKNITFKNTAGQTIEAKKLIQLTLEKMENKVSTAFNMASLPGAETLDKVYFLDVAEEVTDDLKQLSPAFQITSAGKKGFGVAQYEIILETRTTGLGATELINVSKARNEIKQVPQAQTPKDIEDIKARLEALENPEPLKLEKKISRPKPPSQ